MRILIACDFSQRSLKAMTTAARLSSRFAAELVALHVVDDQPEDSATAAAEAARHTIEQYFQAPAVAAVRHKRHLVRQGQAFQVILDIAEEEQADLIVLGEHRRSFVRDIFTGTTVERVIRDSSRPVLVARGDAGAYRHVGACIDTEDDAARVIARAAWIAGDAELSLIHAHDDIARAQLTTLQPEALVSHDAEVKARLQVRFAELAKAAGIGKHEVVLEMGPTLPVLARSIERTEPDLLVVGTRAAARGSLSRWLLGSVAERIIADSACDVLVEPLAEDS